jgi:hypothetical protein
MPVSALISRLILTRRSMLRPSFERWVYRFERERSLMWEKYLTKGKMTPQGSTVVCSWFRDNLLDESML